MWLICLTFCQSGWALLQPAQVLDGMLLDNLEMGLMSKKLFAAPIVINCRSSWLQLYFAYS